MVKRDKESHYLMIKGSMYQENTTIINSHAPKYIKQNLTELNGEINSHTLIAEDLNTLPSTMDGSPRQRINKETMDLNVTDQMHPADIYRTFRPTVAEYIFFSDTHGTFPRRGHMLGHQTSLSKSQKFKIITSIFSEHNSMKLEVSKRKPGKLLNT